jgi:hypothetical protein
MAGDLNYKHVDWNSQAYLETGELLCDYADGNSCLNFVPDNTYHQHLQHLRYSRCLGYRDI